MGNTPSTPPPLVPITPPSNEVLVPFQYCTSVYTHPSRAPGYRPGCQACAGRESKRVKERYQHQHQRGRNGVSAGTPVFRAVDGLGRCARARRKRRSYAKTEGRSVEGTEEEDWRSTDLGEVSEAKGKERRERGQRDGGRRGVEKDRDSGRKGAPAPYDDESRLYAVDSRPSSAPAGDVGLRGGQGHPVVQDETVGGMPYAQPGVHRGMYFPSMSFPSLSPHTSIQPQYVLHESMMGYSPGAGAMHATNPYAIYSLQPPQPPPSTTSPSPSPTSPSSKLPPGVQAAVSAAVQKSADVVGKSRSKPARCKTSPATFVNGRQINTSGDGWGDGINNCMCGTNCKCRKGERATGWYEGIVEITEGEEVPVRDRLNTRWVLADDLGKNCGDHTACKKSVSSSGSDTETFTSKQRKASKRKRKSRRNRDSRLEALKSEIDKMRQEAALRREVRSFSGHGYGLDPNLAWEIERLRMLEISDSSHGIDRVGGMDTMKRTQGIYDSMTTRNRRGPRMPPNPNGMRMQFRVEDDRSDYEDNEGASPGNPYVLPRTLSGKGRNGRPFRSRPRVDLEFRGGVSGVDNDYRSSSRQGIRKNNLQTRDGKFCPRFELDDADVSLETGRQGGIRRKSSDEIVAETYDPPKHGSECKDQESPLRTERAQMNPLGRKGGARHGRAGGRQAHADTDNEDY